MANPNVGYATLSVIPTLKGIRKELESQLEDPLKRSAAKAGERAADELQDAFGSAKLVRDPEELFGGVDTAARRAGGDAADKLSAASSEFRAAGERLSDAAGDGLDLSAAASSAAADVSRSLDGERGSVSSAGERLGRSAGDGVEGGLRTVDLGGVGRDIGGDVGGGINDGILGGVPDLSGGLGGVLDDALGSLPAGVAGPAALVGAAAAGAIVVGFSGALERGQLQSQFEAALGVGESESARLGATAGSIYAQNWGESVAQVGDAITLVQQNFAGVGDLSEAELEQVATAALATSQVFDQDLRQSINAAAQLIRTGLVNDSTEAFDLITAGLQGPANKADDLLDTFNEYSTLFRDLGLEGPEALGLINQAIEAGARDSDKAADALKEFSIRAVDGSETTAAGFAAIGASADDMAQRVGAGGETASSALQDTLEGLRGIEDPALRAQTATALFGTQAEDLGDALFALDLDTAARDLGDVAGSSQDVVDSFDDLGSKVEGLKRQLKDELADAFVDFLAPLAEAASDDRTWQGFGEAIGSNISRGLSITPFGGLIDAANDVRSEIIGSIGDLFGDDGVAQGEATGAAIAGVGREARNAGPPLLDLDDIVRRNTASQEQASITSEEFSDAIDGISYSARSVDFSAAEGRIQSYLAAIEDTSQLDDSLTAALDLSDGVSDLAANIGALPKQLDNANTGLSGFGDEATAALRSVVSLGDDVASSIATAFRVGGADDALRTADEIREALREQFADVGITGQAWDEYQRILGLTPDQVTTAIEVSGTEEAIFKIQTLKDFIGPQLDANPEFQAVIGTEVAEGDFVQAASLIGAFQEDLRDGAIDNPILLYLGADTIPATETTEEWKLETATAEPTPVPLGADTRFAEEGLDAFRIFAANARSDTQVWANTNPATLGVNEFGDQTSGRRFDVVIGANLTPAQQAVAQFIGQFPAFQITGGADGNPLTPRAGGGPVSAGMPYIVGEREPELFVPKQSGRIMNQSQIRDTLGAQRTRERDINLTVQQFGVEARTAPEDLLRATGRALAGVR